MTIRGTRDRARHWLLLTAGTVAAGAIGWALDVACLWTLAVGFGVPTPIAAAGGLIAGAGVNFLVNRVVHGGARKQGRRELARYVALFILNLLIVSASLPLIAEMLGHVLSDRGLELVTAKVIVTAALLLFNAYAYHHWVFGRTPQMDDPGAR